MIFTMEYSGVEGSDKYVIETHGNDLTGDDYVEVFRKMLFLLEFDVKTIDNIFSPATANSRDIIDMIDKKISKYREINPNFEYAYIDGLESLRGEILSLSIK